MRVHKRWYSLLFAAGLIFGCFIDTMAFSQGQSEIASDADFHQREEVSWEETQREAAQESAPQGVEIQREAAQESALQGVEIQREAARESAPQGVEIQREAAQESAPQGTETQREATQESALQGVETQREAAQESAPQGTETRRAEPPPIEMPGEEPWVEEAAEGDVVVRPFFSWFSERDGRFRLSYELINQSEMEIPEVELAFELPENLMFSDHPIKNQRRILHRFENLRQGETRRASTEGKYLNLPTRKDAAEGRTEKLQVGIILRGFGLEHATYDTVTCEPFVFPIPAALPRLRHLLVANLISRGKMECRLPIIRDVPVMKKQIELTEAPKMRHRRLHFMSMQERSLHTVKRMSRRLILPLLVGFWTMLASGKIMGGIWVKRAENQRKFFPRQRISLHKKPT